MSYANGQKYSEVIDMESDKSCRITYYENGNIKKKEYLFNDICHFVDGPAIIKYYPSKIIKSVRYMIEGFYYRENERPAFQSFYENGSIKCEKWYDFSFDCMSYLHSINNKPAVIKYYNNGNVKTQKYYTHEAMKYTHKVM